MDDAKEKYEQMNTICANYRGAVIHSSTLLEGMIDDTLSLYFCSHSEEKREVISHVVFASDRMSFHNKYLILSFIFQKHFPEFTKKYNSTQPSLDTRMGNFYSLRNKFAHRKYFPKQDDIDSFDGKNVVIKLTDGKRGKFVPSTIALDKAQQEEFIKEISSLAVIFYELYQLVEKNEGQ